MNKTDWNTARIVKNLLQMGFINGKRNTHLVQWLIVEYLFSIGRIKERVWFLDTLQYHPRKSGFEQWCQGYCFNGVIDEKGNDFDVGDIRLRTVQFKNGYFWDIWFAFCLHGDGQGKRSEYWSGHTFFRVFPGLWVSDEPNLDIEEE